jgi:succinyl-CoA synthetase beta subunit
MNIMGNEMDEFDCEDVCAELREVTAELIIVQTNCLRLHEQVQTLGAKIVLLNKENNQKQRVIKELYKIAYGKELEDIEL